MDKCTDYVLTVYLCLVSLLITPKHLHITLTVIPSFDINVQVFPKGKCKSINYAVNQAAGKSLKEACIVARVKTINQSELLFSVHTVLTVHSLLHVRSSFNHYPKFYNPKSKRKVSAGQVKIFSILSHVHAISC